MLRTLQTYVCRELLKTFALTAIGLTLTFSLTGGVFNMMRAPVLSAEQTLHLLGFVLPFALTLTLPVAALFSCAMVYGRLAAGNEFDACRASGINIHRLLAPAFGLSVVTAAFTFVFANYVLPSSIRNVEALVARDLQKLIVAALNMQGHFKQGPVVVHAGEPPRTEKTAEGATQVWIESAAFMHIENESLLRVGTAHQVVVDFWTDPSTGDPSAQAVMYDIRACDLEQKRLYASEYQPIEPIAVPMFTETKTKWLNLTELLKFQRDPLKFLPIQRQIAKLRTQAREARFYAYAVEQLNGREAVLRLGSLNGRPKYEVRAKRAYHDPLDFRPQLDGVTVKEAMQGYDRVWHAERCSLRVARGFGSDPHIVQLRLSGQVYLINPLDPEQKRVDKPATNLDPVSLPQFILDWEDQVSDLDLLGITQEHIDLAAKGQLPSAPPPSKFNLGGRVENARISTLGALAEQSLEIVGVIHSRLAFSACVLVMLVLAAGLAIIFRGGQLLTAFIISFVPGMVVVVLNIAGRQLSEKPLYHLTGLAIIWSGIGVLALADVVVLSKFLKR
ncbi:MAG: LptF/LptG family permease [Phycisphaerae bacterium]|nr:LptF/LptG family permease [Phycisphaerae bacterium]